MPLFANTSPFDVEVEKATNEMNTAEDWSLIMDICERVQRTQNGARDCLRSIVKRLNHRVPVVAKQALTLLDACVNNCGRPFHLEICSRDFVSECRTLMSQKAHPKVAQKLRYLIKRWAELPEFKEDAALSLIPSFYESLKKEGTDFSDPDSAEQRGQAYTAAASSVRFQQPKTTTDPNQMAKEEDDIAKAIALSLQEAEKTHPKTTSIYPSSNHPAVSESRPREIRKVRALYDFEAAEDNELTFKGGELISVTDDSDPNWWKGFSHRGEGLFPANFVTADLSVEPEEHKEKKTVQFKDEVEVKTMEPLPDEIEIDENKIDQVLNLIQNADPTGETQPDSAEMLGLEEQCRMMGPLIDAELEKIDRKHTTLVELNQRVMDALQMYHTLMRENPAYSFPKGPTTGQAQYSSLPPNAMVGPPSHIGQQMMYNGPQPSYLPSQPHMGPGPIINPPSQNYSSQPASSQNYSGFATHQLPMSSFSSLPTVSASVGGMANSATTTDSTNGVGISSLQNNPQQTYQNGTMTTGPIPALSSYPGVLQGMNSMAPGLSYQARPQPLL